MNEAAGGESAVRGEKPGERRGLRPVICGNADMRTVHGTAISHEIEALGRGEIFSRSARGRKKQRNLRD